MRLQYDKSRTRLLRGDVEVTIRPMTQEDLPAMRQYDREMTVAIDQYNAMFPPGGHGTMAGGPWSEDQSLADHFQKYQHHGGLTLLGVEETGRIVGFADLWPADEPAPFGRSLDVECIDYFREYYLAGLEAVLLAEAEKVACAAGLPALDIGTNTCSGDYVSLRTFGLKVFYEYDHVLCRCPRSQASPRARVRPFSPQTADLAGLVKASHWSPTDFTFRGDDEPTYLAELIWPDKRAFVELWQYRDGADNSPVPPNPPNKSELYVQPAMLDSSAMITDVLVECASLAGELGAEQIELPCPSEVPLESGRLDVVHRQFAFAWLRKRL